MLNVLEVKKILEQVEFNDWKFVVVGKSLAGEIPNTRSMEEFERSLTPTYLQVTFSAPDVATGRSEAWKGRKWQLSPYMTTSEIVTTAFKAVLTAIEHETRESFRYKGQPIFGPHINVEHLVDLHKNNSSLDVRQQEEKQHVSNQPTGSISSKRVDPANH